MAQNKQRVPKRLNSDSFVHPNCELSTLHCVCVMEYLSGRNWFSYKFHKRGKCVGTWRVVEEVWKEGEKQK